MVVEGGEDFSCDSAVVVKVFGVDEDVVHVADEFPTADEVSEDVVHHGLECCGGVAQAKEHHLQFIQPTVGSECGFPFITFLNPSIIETPAEVQPGEPLGLMQSG